MFASVLDRASAWALALRAPRRALWLVALLVAGVGGTASAQWLTPDGATATVQANQQDFTLTSLDYDSERPDDTEMHFSSEPEPSATFRVYWPTITITPGTRSGTSQPITIDWDDDAVLDDESRSIIFNGANVTSSFSYALDDIGNGAYSQGTVTLQSGNNTLTAHICDFNGDCISNSWSYFLDVTAPTISLNPASGVYASSTRSLSITWCDNGSLNQSSRNITISGDYGEGPVQTNVTSNFNYMVTTGGCATSSGSFTLFPNTTTLTAKICDFAGNCRTSNGSYVWDDAAPVVSISPADNGDNMSSSVTATVGWSDNYGLSLASRSVTLNGASVTSGFPYSGSGTSGTSSGTLALAAGANTFTARICDQAGTCTSRSVTYTYTPPTYTVAVTPDGVAASADANASNAQAFTVKNNGNTDATYTLTCSNTMGTCSLPGGSSVAVTKNGGTKSVSVTYQAGAAGSTGTVGLTASYGGYTDAGSVSVTAYSHTVAVTPDGGAMTATANRSNTASFIIRNTGTGQAAYTLSKNCPGTTGTCSLSVSSNPITLSPGAAATATVTYGAGADASTGSAHLTATYTGNAAVHDEGWVNWTVQAPCSGTYSSISPCGTTMVATPGASGQYTFSIENIGNIGAIGYTLSCRVPLPGSATCSVSPTNVSANQGQSTSAVLRYTASTSEGVSEVRLLAASTADNSEQLAASLSLQVLAATSVAVTTPTTTTRLDSSATATHPFTVRNAGPLRATYTLVPNCTTSAATNCQPSLASVTLDPGATANVSVSYHPGSPGSVGTVGLTAKHAQNAAITSTATATITVNKYAVAVTPDNGSVTVDRGSTKTYPFTVQNTGNLATATFTLTTPCTTPVTNCSPSPNSVTLGPGASTTVNVTYTADGTGGVVRLHASSGTYADDGTVNVTVPPTYPVVASATEAAAAGTTADSSTSFAFPVTEKRPDGSWPQVGTVTGQRVAVPVGGTVTFTVGATDAFGLDRIVWDVYEPSGAYVTTYNTALSGTSGTASVSQQLTAKGTWRVHAHVINADGNIHAIIFSADANGSDPGHPTSEPWTIVAPQLPLVTTSASLNFTVTFCDEDSQTGLAYRILLDDVDVTSTFQNASGTVPPDCNTYVRVTGALTVTPGSHTLTTDVRDSDDNEDFREDYWIYNPYIVGVTPADTDVSVIGAPSMTQTFVVRNIGAASTRYTVTATCGGSAYDCSVPMAETPLLAPGESTTITGSYHAGGAGTEGHVWFKASYNDDANVGETSASSHVTITAPFTVTVTPVDEEVGAEVGITNEQIFTVTNTASVPITYSLTPSCTGSGVSDCTAPAQLALGAHESADVTVSYLAGSAGLVGTVALRAYHPTDSLNAATGSVQVTVGVASAGTLDEVPSTEDVQRDECITAAAGAAAAYECGDLRIVHPLPAIRTLGRERVPVLLYNSQYAQPYPIVAANVMLPAGQPLPDSVVATLFVSDAERGHGKWLGGEWVAGAARRIAVGFDASTFPTGLYPFSLEIRRWTSTGSMVVQIDTGQLAIVNRGASTFGAGWWLAGLEQLFFVGDGSILWVGGDGSTRHFRPDPSAPDVWRAAAVDRPDSLVRVGGEYLRNLPGGITVKFDTTGRHVATLSRHQQQTTFVYDAGGRLQSITVPLGPAPTYTFAYTGGVLDSVIAPGPRTTARVTQVTTSGGRITAIRDPGDAVAVAFGYAASPYVNRITARTDRRAHTVTYAYGAGGKLTTATLTPSIVHGFRAAEAKGLSGAGASGAVAPKDMNTELLGPRTDVADNTYLWINRFGSPKRIKNALGRTTIIAYDATWPALPMAVRSPTGQVLTAEYTPQGLLSTVVDSSLFRDTLGTRVYATTRYEWDTAWQFIKKITLPEGEVTEFAYDSATGDRLWQQVASDPARRVEFGYNTLGLVRWVKAPLTPAESLVYDARGNLQRQVDPSGFQTLIFRDNLGRDTLVITPVDTITARDSAQLYAAGVRQRTVYDAIGRVDTTMTIAPSVTYAWPGVSGEVPSDTAFVHTSYDAEDAPLTVERWTRPDSAGVGVLITTYGYDAIGRLTKEFQPGGSGGRYELDAAGNRISDTTSEWRVIQMRYDALNRLTERIVPEVSYSERPWCSPVFLPCPFYSFPRYSKGLTLPADTARYQYDAGGNMTSATNRWARVWRSYAPSGLLTTDSIHIQPYVESYTGSLPQQIYGLQYGYDLNGRRSWLRHPQSLAPTCPGGSGVCDRVAYDYDAATGALKTVHGLTGDTYQYSYDAAGRLTRLSFPGGVYDSSEYNPRGTTRRLLRTPARTLFDDRYTRDPLGRALEIVSNPGLSTEQTSRNAYSGHGHLVATEWHTINGSLATTEQYRPDALGHFYWRRLNGDPDSTYRYRYRIDAGEWSTGQLEQLWQVSPDEVSYRDTTVSEFDFNGNLELSWHISRTMTIPATNEVVASYYDAENRLRVVDRETGEPETPVRELSSESVEISERR